MSKELYKHIETENNHEFYLLKLELDKMGITKLKQLAKEIKQKNYTIYKNKKLLVNKILSEIFI